LHVYHDTKIKKIAVGTAIAGRPPYRSARAELPHTALTLDVDVSRTARWDKDEGLSASVASVHLASRTSPKLGCVLVDFVVTPFPKPSVKVTIPWDKPGGISDSCHLALSQWSVDLLPRGFHGAIHSIGPSIYGCSRLVRVAFD
jgi:hypothetical protein